jgi:glutamate N-acetyltransferase/amino-acid N-acetyltransferase
MSLAGGSGVPAAAREVLARHRGARGIYSVLRMPRFIGAMTKGSGMIHPNLGTMLCFITTDAAISAPLLETALKSAARRSFNRLTVDGDTSTNDTAIIMASALAGNPPIETANADYTRFSEAVEAVCVSLARKMARDGEGASRLLTVTVEGAGDEDGAALLARAVASSSLVKAACFGADANWGRVLCALGYSGAEFDLDETTVRFVSAAGEITVCAAGLPVPFDEGKAKEILTREEIEIRVKVGSGPGAASAWGCDLTYDYVKINGDYRS